MFYILCLDLIVHIDDLYFNNRRDKDDQSSHAASGRRLCDWAEYSWAMILSKIRGYSASQTPDITALKEIPQNPYFYYGFMLLCI